MQLHCAIRTLGRIPEERLLQAEDWGHIAFVWDDERHAFFSNEIVVTTPYRAARNVPDATALLVDGDGARLAEHGLGGSTSGALAAWVEGETRRLGPAVVVSDNVEPCDPIAPFSLDATALAEFARYYGNARRLLEWVRATWSERSEPAPVLVWLHHFDMASLLVLDPGAVAEEARSIGVGLSPGDG